MNQKFNDPKAFLLSHVCLLSTRNVAFSRLLAQIIQLRAQFLDHPIKTIHLENASEFSSQAFLDYCMSIGVDVQYLIDHVHTITPQIIP